MWTTKVQNNCTFAITANGVLVAPSQNTSVSYVATGVAIQVPGIGQIQVLDAGSEVTGTAVKLVSGDSFSYLSYTGQPTITVTVATNNGQTVFSVDNGGPSNVAVQRSSPDGVFPVPSLFGEINHDGVNLFTGDVNRSYALATISDGRLTYDVTAFYNSRSVGIAAASDNLLGGNGWKLLDYPKVAREGSNFYLLDGKAAYLLTTASSGSGYVAGRDYHAWTFSKAADDSSWTATDDSGIQYVLGNKSLLATQRTAWHLSSITDSRWTSSVLTFAYTNNAIQTISNSLGDVLTFSYANGCVSAVSRSVAGSALSQTSLTYSTGVTKPLLALQSAVVLPGGGTSPVDGGHLFQYYPSNDPIYPLALSSTQSPLGAVTTYTYYNGGGIISNGTSYTGWHPAVTVTTAPQSQVSISKGLFYSYWSWAFDPAQTYIQWNLAKIYAGGVYTSIDDDDPTDPYGHTSHLFFSGQPADALINYSGGASTALDRSVIGKVYWSGDFEVVRTGTLLLENLVTAGAWPGLVRSPQLPAGALLAGMSASCSPNGVSVSRVQFDMEKDGQQANFVGKAITGPENVTLQLHSLTAGTNVRAWSPYQSTLVENWTATYVTPPPSPVVPPITNVPHVQQAWLSGEINPIPLSPGITVTLPVTYTGATSLVIWFASTTLSTGTLTVRCYDSKGTQVGTGTFQTVGGTIATLTFNEPAEVASVVLTAVPDSGGAPSVRLVQISMNYLANGQPVTDDALAWNLSNEQMNYVIGRPGAASFAKLTLKMTSTDGVAQTTSYTYGDDQTLPYPVTVTQTVAKPDQNRDNATVTITQQLTYAVQKYPALAANNVLSPVAEVVTTSAPNGSNAAAVAGSAMLWQQWGSVWDEATQYRLQSSTVTDPFGAGGPDASWLMAAKVTKRNARGNPIASQATNGMVASALYDANTGARLVASFVNADVNTGQCGWLGFESYESTAPWTLANGSVSSNQAFTGFASYGGTNATVRAATFQPRANSRYIVAAYVRLDPNAQCTIGFLNGTVWSGQKTINYDPNNPGWIFVQAMLDAPSAQQVPAVMVTSGSIDHVVFAPADASYEANVWNLSKRQVIARVTPNGAVDRTFFDATNNTLAAATPGNSLALIDHSYSSVLGQLWFSGRPVYSDALPNQSLTVRAPHDGTWDDFTSLSRTAFNASALNRLTMIGNHVLQSQTGVSSGTAGYAYAAVQPSAADFVVCAEVITGATAPAAGQMVGLTIRGSSGTDLWLGVGNNTIALTDLTNGNVLQSTALQQIPPSIVLTLVVRQGTTLYAYADGNYLFTQTLAAAARGPVGVRTTWPGSSFYNFGLVSAPAFSANTSDGSGAEMQRIATSSATSSTVSQSLYGGNLMLYAGKTLPTIQPQASLAPVAGFASLNASTMTVSGSITSSWPQVFSTTPFSESMQQFNDPALRTKSSGAGGIFTAGQQGSVTYAYGENTDGFFGFTTDALHIEESIIPNAPNATAGTRVVRYSNLNGQLFGKARVDTATNNALLTGYEYDAALRRRATHYPAAYTSASSTPANGWLRTASYDFLGRTQTITDSDSGQTNFLWDSSGRPRVMQDAAGAAANPQYSSYTKYDARGRVVERGTWSGAFNQITAAQLDDPAWPQQNNTVLQSFTWDLPNSSEPYSIGRLTSAATPSFTQWYYYDRRGLPIQVLGNSTFLITDLSLGYDDAGRLTSMTEPGTGYDVVYGYDEQGRVLSIGTTANPSAYATYTYGNGTVTERLLNGAATRAYTMNARGDLQSVVDQYVSQTLYYEQRFDGQPGYVNGQVASASYAFGSWTNGTANAPQPYVVDYTYDRFGRLTAATNSAYSAGSIGSASSPVTYDNNGNVLSMTRGGVSNTYAYTANTNLLATVNGGTAFTYDANGNATSSPPRSITAMTYQTGTNLPASATTAAANVRFVYDANGQRVRRKTANQSIAYMRDPAGRLLCEEIETASGTANVAYVYGLYGRIAMVPLDGSGKAYALLNDRLGSPLVVVDQNSHVAAWFNYDPFGQLLSAISSAGTIGLRHLYTGREWDSDLQLYDFAARLYDPAVCRFMAPDPLHQFASPYIYADNPVSYEDPTGEWFLALLGVAAVGAVAGAGIEVLREWVHGEEFSKDKILRAAGIGAAAGALAMFTGGGSAVAALEMLGQGVGTGAAIGGGFGALRGTGILRGMMNGAQGGLISAPITALVTPSLGRSLPPQWVGPGAGAVSGAASGVTNAVIRDENLLVNGAYGAMTGAIGGAMPPISDFLPSMPPIRDLLPSINLRTMPRLPRAYGPAINDSETVSLLHPEEV